MTRANPMAVRRSLEDRLHAVALESGRDLNWLRRRHVFLRALHRIVGHQPDAWVLKGGFAVELRRPGLARTTRDIDLSSRRPALGDQSDQLMTLLREALDVDIDGDLFVFRILSTTPLADDAYGRPAWRFGVEAALAGKLFVRFPLDVVQRPEELVGLAELPLPAGVVAQAGAAARVIVVTDLRQQFAEKLHALTRSYGTGGSTRVKDLVDLVLLVEDGLVGDATLYRIVTRVFAVRGSGVAPRDLDPPPASWADAFPVVADSVGLIGLSAADASGIVTQTWRAACAAADREDS